MKLRKAELSSSRSWNGRNQPIGNRSVAGKSGSMKPPADPHYRFPVEIISHAVWLYHVFTWQCHPTDCLTFKRFPWTQ